MNRDDVTEWAFTAAVVAVVMVGPASVVAVFGRVFGIL